MRLFQHMKQSSVWSLIAAGLIALALLWAVGGSGSAGDEAKVERKNPGAEFARESKSGALRSETRKRERERKQKKATQYKVENILVEGTYEFNLTRNLRGPFDPEELLGFAAEPGKDPRRLMELLLRAAADKDGRFLDLLQRPELRGEPEVELGLLTYDYAVTKNPAALEAILNLHYEEPGRYRRSWDTNVIMALSYIGEWDLTKQALESRLLSGDGTGGGARYAFWLRRRHLFPNDKSFPETYEQFQEEIIAAQKSNDPGGRNEVPE
jgi:hypothetical protein